ncbi:MAG TPA: protein-disulfide reductase DsbD [Burkholderiales bacterium]|nr:protein-disulfide reductase DsbD [Burkholderiales bacterium]
MKPRLRLFAVLAALFAAPALAQLNLGASSGGLLEPDKAFQFSARALGADAIEVSFKIADGYYMYRDKFRFALDRTSGARLGAPDFPAGIRKKDEFFGEIQTYRNAVSIRIPVERTSPQATTLLLKVTSQGCADLGVCYTPMDSTASIRLAALGGGPGAGPPALDEGPRSVAPAPRFSLFASDRDIAALFDHSLWLVILGFFGLGLLLTFTPCVLPMVPIISGIVAGEGKRLNKLRALALSVSYVLGMAVTYAAAGVAAAYSGSMVAAALQNPWVLSAFALVFVWLALSMFGFHDLQLPGFLHHHVSKAHERLQGGRIASVAAMGVLSALIVSPCVTAPLAGALLVISQTGNVARGGAALFSMAIGMGVPLIAVGVSEGALLPKSGPWMEGVKKFFGVLLLAVAIWIVSPAIPPGAEMLLWAALLIGSAMFLRALDSLPPTASGYVRIWKGVGLMALVAGAAILVGALAGSRDPLRPLAGLAGASAPAAAPIGWVRVASVAELDDKLRAPGRPVMLDFYADWCVSCKEMERFTFSDRHVRARLDDLLLLQADVTANTEQQKLLLKRFSLFGPPGIIFFDGRGREIEGLRVVGYQDAERFLKTLALATATP